MQNLLEQYFPQIFPHNLVDLYHAEREQPSLYSQQKGRSLGIDKTEALTLLGIMLLSEYNRLPYRRLY